MVFLVYNVVILIAGGPFSYILGVQFGLPRAGLAVLAGIGLIMFGMLIVRLTGRLDVASHWVSASLFFVILTVSYYAGGITSPAMWWLVLCPVYTLLFSGLRGGMFWVNMIVLAAAGLFLMRSQIPPISERLSTLDHHWFLLSGFLGLTASLVGYIASYRFGITDNEIERLNRRRRMEREARKRAEKASRIKSQFLSNISHEIRTPINTITGMMDVLRTSGVSKEQQQHLTVAEEAARQLLDTIDTILDIAQVEADSIELQVRPFEVRSTINEVLRGLSPGASEQDIELIQQVSPSVPVRVGGDKKRFRQVLFHLVENAILHSGASEVLVSVDVEEHSKDVCRLRFRVRDDGTGINEDEQRDVFEGFFRSSESQDRQVGGTGAGLAICKKLVNLFGGQISLDSTPGKGSTFELVLPFETDGIATEPPTYETAELTDVQVLILDDSGTRQNVLSSQFQEWGMHPTIVEDVRDLLKKMRERFDSNNRVLLVLNVDHMDRFDEQVREEIEDHYGRIPPVLTLVKPGYTDGSCEPVKYGVPVFGPVDSASLLKKTKEALMTGTSSPVPSNTASSPSSEGPHREDDRRILLVDDNDPVRKVIAMQLERLGHSVTAVSGGREALERVRSDDPAYDVVIMDVQMPEMDGMETTKRIREIEGERGSVPVLALTAQVQTESRKTGLDAGMTAYLTKPTDSDKLQDVIRDES